MAANIQRASGRQSKSKTKTRRRGKGKGSAFERRFAKLLSLWWSSGEHDDLFYRTAISGGRATARSQQGKTTRGAYGDIQATSSEGSEFTKLFSVELKKGYNQGGSHFARLLDGRSDLWFKWVFQASKNSDGPGRPRHWMIVHAPDRLPPVVCLPSDLMQGAFSDAPTFVYGDASGRQFRFVSLDWFFEVITPKMIIEAIGN